MVLCDIYCRVSTAGQAEKGYSLEEQESALRAYAASQSWLVNAVYVDGGYTGKNLNRPGMQAIISDCQQHKVSKVLVYKLDRLSRSLRETLELIEDVFTKNGVDFVSATQNFDTGTPLGRLMLSIVSAFAELERDVINERMTAGRNARVKSGVFRGGGNTVTGYRWNAQTQTLSVDEYESVFVRNMFEWYLAGETMSGIARKLNLTYQFRGHNWSASNIKRILTNPLYIGLQRWNGELIPVNDCPCIIDKETFDNVQKALARRCAGKADEQKKRQTGYKHVTLLGGLIWCGKCGYRYTGIRDRTHGGKFIPRYYCQNRLSAGRIKGCKCLNKGYRCDVLDNAVIAQIKLLNTDRSIIADKVQGNSAKAEIDALNGRIEDITKQIARMIDLYAIGSISSGLIGERVNALNAERDSLTKRLSDLMDNEKQRLTLEDVNRRLDTFADLVEAAESDVMLLYPVVHELINSITINDDDITIDWNLDAT